MDNALVLVLAMSGVASQYSPGLMEEVVVNRQLQGYLPEQLPLVDGYVAMKGCDYIGAILHVRPKGGAAERMLVCDCAGDDVTREWMDQDNILLEVDYPTAVRWDTVGRGIQVELIGLERR